MKKKRFTKKDIVSYIYDNNKWSLTSKTDIERIINLFIDFFKNTLVFDFTIELRGLGIFSVKTIPAREQAWNINKNRILLNNSHKEPRIKFPESKSVRFKPSVTLRKIINEKKMQDENGSRPTTTSLKRLKNATKEEINEALNLLLNKAKPMTKKDEFN